MLFSHCYSSLDSTFKLVATTFPNRACGLFVERAAKA